ncbi:MAG TPA: hypothetical protein ACFYD6_08570 [Candidatus Brocadiia bacterium]|nr:hypothetical protein [Planctomycetota bacterium]MBI4008442.1 hypothetical protein [Planctomycetota bacterium]MDO8093381.1 hypothetical protein [Candidatus Brocadiales bacterium]
MIENLVAEIQNIETKADSIIADAQKKARQSDIDAENEVKQLTIDFEKEFQQKVNELKLRIDNSKRNEEAYLKAEFERMKAQLAHLNQGVFEQVIGLVAKGICES